MMFAAKYFLVGSASVLYAAIAYQTVNFLWGGIILLVLSIVYLAVIAFIMGFGKISRKDPPIQDKRFWGAYGFFFVGFVVGALLWISPSEHETWWGITTMFAFTQSIPLLGLGIRHSNGTPAAGQG